MFKFGITTLGMVALLGLAAFLGGVFSWAALGYITVLAYAIDRIAPEDWGNPDPDMEFPASDALLAILGILHFPLLAMMVLALTGYIGAHSGAETLALFAASALYFGQISHPNAHELIHRPSRMLRRLGVAVYCSVLIGHHNSSHRLVHHMAVGTDGDPVSAPKGRGFWRFFIPAWTKSYMLGRAQETRRSLGSWHAYHSYALGACAGLAFAYAWAGSQGVVALALIALYVQLQMFLSDYVQHYGLRRRQLDTGKFEPVGPQHSWNTPHRFSGAMMMRAPRHSDHHSNPQRPYTNLQLHPETMPILPYSLPMMAVIALMPPLWRKLMDDRVDQWT